MSIQNTQKKTCIVGISGGVDSATTLVILQQQNFYVEAVHLKMLDTQAAICAHDDAKKVADFLKIKFHCIDIQEKFQQKVIDEFCNSYLNGKTPNPCVLCNANVKFEILNEIRMQLGFDFLATGHYAKIEHFKKLDDKNFNDQSCDNQNVENQNNKNQNDENLTSYTLGQAKDKIRDQSYFLYKIADEILRYTLFPLGNYKKDEVREVASKHSIHIAQKNDSQDICFLGGGKNYFDFIKNYVQIKDIQIKNSKEKDNEEKGDGSKDKEKKLQSDKKNLKKSNELLENFYEKLENQAGNIIDGNGQIIGTHPSFMRYTIGQRKGLNLSGGPFYVKKIIGNDVVVEKTQKFGMKIIVLNEVKFNKAVEFCDGKKIVNESKFFNAKIELLNDEIELLNDKTKFTNDGTEFANNQTGTIKNEMENGKAEFTNKNTEFKNENISKKDSQYFAKIRSNDAFSPAKIAKVDGGKYHVFIRESAVAIDQHCVIYNEKYEVVCGGIIAEVIDIAE